MIFSEPKPPTDVTFDVDFEENAVTYTWTNPEDFDNIVIYVDGEEQVIEDKTKTSETIPIDLSKAHSFNIVSRKDGVDSDIAIPNQ